MELHRVMDHHFEEAFLSEAFTIAIAEHSIRNYSLLADFYLPPGSDASNPTAFTMTTTLYDYGYRSISMSVRLSIVTISTYHTIIVLYIVYILVTGSTSTAWNSAIELVVLALQSKKPDHLGNTSVGIDSVKTFSQSVGIRVNKDDELELVFAHDADTDKRGLRKIERNKGY